MSQESETNDTIATADLLAFGIAVSGNLYSTTDVDIYKFTVDTAGSVSIAFDSPLNSTLDYFGFGLYDSDGNTLGFYRTGQDRTVSAYGSYSGPPPRRKLPGAVMRPGCTQRH